ncbi:lamin tail domain-containing protein [Nitrosopumilus sp. S4]
MKSALLILFSVVLLAGVLIPVYAQTSPDHVVINEVEINPPGNDATSVSEWVELYNPTNSDVDLSGWKIASTTVLKKTMTIPSGTIIKPGQFLTYSYQSLWFTDSNESVELRDASGTVVDKTPILSDIFNDLKSWQRIYDGYDLDSSDDWKFTTSTAGSSNGKLVVNQATNEVTVTVSSDKPSYLFGETAVIKGTVSKEVFIVKPTFQPEPILVKISGPNYDKTVSLYPDLNRNYKTTISLHQVLGINEGVYNVSVSYAGAEAKTNFSVGHKIIEQTLKTDAELSIFSDKSQYLPGQLVSITGFTSKVIPFEGMKLTVKDSEGNLVSEGNLYPTKDKFATSVYLTTVKPVYGTYQIIAEYSGKSAVSTFDVVKDIKEDVPISLWTDKKAYGLGEQVNISGRINHVWISTLDLEIVQTKQTTITSGSDSGFKILDSARIMGDGSFTYTFTIPDNKIRLGDYKISVSKSIGSATTIIHAVTNPGEFIATNESLTVNSDKEVYSFGDSIKLNGFIRDPTANSSYVAGTPVKISISHEDGSPLEIIALAPGAKTRTNNGVVVAYDFTAIPSVSGSYSLDITVSKNIFTVGNYVVKSQYAGHTATKTFSIIDPLSFKDGPQISLDKEVYGLSQTVTLSGVFPPTGDNSVKITLTKPDGTKVLSGATINAQKFVWTWNTPIVDKVQSIKDESSKNTIKTNYGVYKIKVATNSYSKDLFFKVSADPANDSLSNTPLFVTTEKSLYKAGEKLKVLGNVIKRVQGDEGLVVPDRVTIKIIDGVFPFKQILESAVYPSQGGDFSSFFDLPITVFTEGTYSVKAVYNNAKAESTFSVANDFSFGSDASLTLLLEKDKSEYYPGDTVVINGKPNKLIYLEKYDVSVIKKSATEITCGTFYCGKHTGPITTIRPSPSGSFTYEYTIPNKESSLGSYEVTVDADFETKSLKFNVVEKPLAPKLDTVIEKENRISEKMISVVTATKTVDSQILSPRVLSGSLLTPAIGDESSVNLQIMSSDGTCIIGQLEECLVKESTRKQGQIYDVVEIDGINYNVRYSGSDVRLEKFTILPESSDGFLPDTNWNIEILKDDQISRFYYKITYKSVE